MERKFKSTLEAIMQKISAKLGSDSKSHSSAELEIENIIQMFKVTNGITKLKTRNICEEQLLLRAFEWANTILAEEE